MNSETISPTLPRESIKTVNGKLIVQEQNGIEGVKTRINELGQQFEYLGQKMTLSQYQQKQECLQQIQQMRSSLQGVEQLYRRLFKTSLATAITFGLILLWMNVHPRSECSRLSQEDTRTELTNLAKF